MTATRNHGWRTTAIGFVVACLLVGSTQIAGSQPAPHGAGAYPTPEPVCAGDALAGCDATCAAGDWAVCADLAEALSKADQYERAHQLFSDSCDHGVAKGCNGLGVFQELGLLGAADHDSALARYIAACEMGYAASCFNVGQQHFHGVGRSVDVEQSAIWYQRACEVGDADGCMVLGTLYQEGHGVPKDPVKAAAALQMGCDGGAGGACHNLGMLALSTGRVDQAEALFERACKLGLEISCDMEDATAAPVEKGD